MRTAAKACREGGLTGAVMQVWTQPLFSFVEERIFLKFPNATWMQKDLTRRAPVMHSPLAERPWEWRLEAVVAAGRTAHLHTPGCSLCNVAAAERAAARAASTSRASALFRINVFRLLWRSFYVVLTTLLAALLPARPLMHRFPACKGGGSSCGLMGCCAQFFNDIVGLLGALGFWPLTIFFPTQARARHPLLLHGTRCRVCCTACSRACTGKGGHSR